MIEPLRPGDPREVGPYALRGRLGADGLGRLFLGRAHDGRLVAVRVIFPGLADDEGFRRGFAAEVEAARRVCGPFTVPVVDADTSADQPWLATAYVPGPCLRRAVETHGPLPAGALPVLGAGVAEGLAAIHAHDLVHRDLTPGNVLLSDAGPRLTGFGVARALDAVSHTGSRAAAAPAFMPPEQVRGLDVGPPGDVFSLGAVLAFAATGRSPFGDGPGEAVRFRVVHEDPDLSGLPTDLALLITACLAKNPHHRPTVTDVLDRLTAPPQKPGQEPGRPAAQETIQGAGRRAALEAGQEAPRWPPTSATTVIAHPRRAAAQLPSDPTDGPRGSAPVVDVAEVAAVGLAITTPAMRAAKRVTDVGVGALQIAALFGAVGLMTLIISGDPGWAWEFTRHLASGFWWFWILGLAAAFVHSGSDGHDRLTVDADRIVVADERWVRWRDRSLSIPWTRIERVRLVAEPGGTAHSVVVTFRDGHEPGKRWETRHNVRTRHGGHVVARLSVAPGDLARAALPSRLRDALRRHGKDKYTPDPPPGA
ncbi:serine/threonine-protein kinase [Nonomuraea maritima]|uniref:serine/threonine-protein kinase n=1 Tax=Nonomuraea maritima TaxID=683260 RepID=UPI001FE20D07|nr:serine/threonine-protein kinase [Nonomuraea maritima]